ncbi:MAG: hypothetical protein ACK5P7_04620, partial [Bdellovibrio sp.]
GLARTTATDIQEVFERPSQMWDLSDQVTIEFGGTGTTYDPTATTSFRANTNAVNAEGGFIRSHNNTKWGAYVGHQSTSLNYMLSGATVGVALTPTAAAAPNSNSEFRRLENPLNLWYGMKTGDLELGFNLFYASSERKAGFDQNKKSAYGVSFGAKADRWSADAVVGLGAKVEDTSTGANSDFKSTASFKIDTQYAVNDDISVYGILTNFGGKTTNAGVEVSDLEHMRLQLGVESKIKSDVAHFFYGAQLDNGTEKNKATNANPEKVEFMVMPLYFGFEVDAASWLVVRANLRQNVLLNSVKQSSATAALDGDNNVDSTSAGLGAGLKFGKLLVDGTMAAGTSGRLGSDGANFMSNLSATYMF